MICSPCQIVFVIVRVLCSFFVPFYFGANFREHKTEISLKKESKNNG
nr:MAG TPA: hypothetical protein [Caudoviricetes sp.]